MLPSLSNAQGSANPNFYQFPHTFRWGCATAAYQVEGGAKEGSRGASIWDTFSHRNMKDIYITENGCSSADVIAPDERAFL